MLIGKHTVAAILHGLATPPRANGVQHLFIFFAYRKASPWTICQVIDLFFNPTDGIFREDRRGAHFACLVADDQLVVLDPDGTRRQMMGQRQRAAYRNGLIHVLLIHLGVVLRTLGTHRRFYNVHQCVLMRLNTVGQGREL